MLKGINLCHCGSGATVIKEFYKISRETEKYYIIETIYGNVRIDKNTKKVVTKDAKLLDEDGTLLEIMKDYYNFYWSEIVYD